MKRKNVADDTASTEAAVGRSATDRLQAVVLLATPYAQGAADRFVPLARAAGGRAAPLVQSAAGRVGPWGSEALRRVSPYGRQAVVLLVPYAQQAAGRVAPLAQTAKQRGTLAAQQAAKAMGPRLDEAWGVASASPVVVEVTKRGRATLAAARGELSLPELASKKDRIWPKRLAVFAGAAGVGVMVARRLLGTKDADWTAATTVDEVPTPAPPVDETVPKTTDETVPNAADEAAPTLDTATVDPSDPVIDDVSPTADAPRDGSTDR